MGVAVGVLVGVAVGVTVGVLVGRVAHSQSVQLSGGLVEVCRHSCEPMPIVQSQLGSHTSPSRNSHAAALIAHSHEDSADEAHPHEDSGHSEDPPAEPAEHDHGSHEH